MAERGLSGEPWSGLVRAYACTSTGGQDSAVWRAVERGSRFGTGMGRSVGQGVCGTEMPVS